MSIHRSNSSKKGAPPPDENEKKAYEKKALEDQKFRRLTDASIEEINKDWADTEETGTMWEIIKNQEFDSLLRLLGSQPEYAHVRSKDGRGPMFWAHEYGRPKMIHVLRQLGVSEERADANGIKASDITHSSIKGKLPPP